MLPAGRPIQSLKGHSQSTLRGRQKGNPHNEPASAGKGGEARQRNADAEEARVSRFVFGFLAGPIASKEEIVMNARVSMLMGILTLALFVPQAAAVHNGQVDANNTYSNVGTWVGQLPGAPPFVFCSGTLIHPRVLLTAGHATYFIEQNPWVIPLSRVSFGTDAFDPRTWHEVEAVITHPDYRAPTDPSNFGTNNPHMSDVGVIILKEPVYNVRLAELPYEGFLDDVKAADLLRGPRRDGEPFTVAGYGTSLDWPPPEIVPPDGLRRFAETEYLGLTKSWLFTLTNPATGNGGTGYGDSGGPTFWLAPDGTLVLVAVISRGDPYGLATNIAWRVDIPETLDFIYGVLAAVESP